MDELKRAVAAYLAVMDRERKVRISLNQALLRGDSSVSALLRELNATEGEILDRERYLRTLVK
jgi:hypothetical protein